MIQSADPSFAPCLLPTDGTVEAPPTAGSDSLKVTDLPLAPGQFGQFRSYAAGRFRVSRLVMLTPAVAWR